MNRIKTYFLTPMLVFCLLLGMVPSSFAADWPPKSPDFSVTSGQTQLSFNILDSANMTVELVIPDDNQDASSYSGSIAVPSEVEYDNTKYTVTAIGDGAFRKSAVTSVTLPESITSIGASAFDGCQQLTALTLPAAVKEIGSAAFRNCTELTSMVIPSGVEILYSATFSGCSKLTSITLPETLKTIESQVFLSCSALSELSIPNSVTSIGANAFSGCSVKMTIPAGVTSGLKNALVAHKNINNVAIAENSPYILENGILYNKTILEGAIDVNVTKISVRDGTTAIADGAFAQQTSLLSEITFPDTLVSIGKEAFEGCTKLTTANLPDGLSEIGESAFADCESLKKVVIPNGVTSIPDYAFVGCLSLEEIILPEGLRTIGEYSFDLTAENDDGDYVNSNPKLAIIDIPSTVTSLGENFLGGLKANGGTVLVSNVASPEIFTEDALAGISGDGMNQPTIFYPASAEDAYTGVSSTLSSFFTDDKEYGYGLSLTNSGFAKSATYNPSITVPTGATVTASSSNTDVATVTYDTTTGLVVAGTGEGEASIKVSITVNGFTLIEDTCTVTVTEDGAVIPHVEEPVVSVANGITGDAKTAVESVAGSIEANETLTTAAQAAANSLSTNEQTSLKADASSKGLSSDQGDTVTLYTQTFLEIQATNVDTDSTDTNKITSITLNITPKMQVVASTAENSADIKLKTEDGSAGNAVVVKDPQSLTITSPAQITVTLPSNFAGWTVYIKHEATSGGTYYYQATADSNGTLTFTSKHGFSPFTFSLTNSAVAQITTGGETIGYDSLQAAVNAAQDGDVIKVVNNNNNLSATMTGSSRTITVKNGTQNTITVTINGEEKTIAANDNTGVQFTYTRPSSGGVTTYSITAPAAVNNGTLSVSTKSAAKGATVTITVTPDQGYQLSSLTVTDAKGNQLTLTDKGNGKYTFVMPASKVDVAAAFAKIPDTHLCPSAHLTDIDTTQWYHEGVDYVVSHGMMVGVTPTTFGPNDTTTRGMIVTILYRLEGSPAVTAANPFTDVADNEWYGKAVIWAAENGVVTGDTPTTFSPNDPITREQMAAILYRYASLKGYDVTDQADLSGYTDADQVSSYATQALQWANQAGLITGTTPTTLSPTGNALRAQVATIFQRFCESVAQ